MAKKTTAHVKPTRPGPRAKTTSNPTPDSEDLGPVYGGRRPTARSLGRKIRSGTGVSGTAKRSASSKKPSKAA